ncbi:MAG: DNA alkylation repair protein [Planctomycetota bacterium]
MTKAEVLAWLKENQDPRGVAHWKAHKDESGGLSSYGLGLVKLRKYAKALGRDRKLAKTLWRSKVYEMKVISLLIDDPKQITREQAEEQVEQLQGGYLAHVFSSCDATLAKTDFAFELAERWIESKDDARKRCGYGLLYEVSKSKKKSAPGDEAFLGHIARIEKSFPKQSIQVLMSMGGALLGIGSRNRKLHTAALKVAKRIGPIEFDPTGKCAPMDVAKNLSHKLIRERVGK